MAKVLPKTLEGVIVFCEEHDDIWTDDPAAIGLTAAEVTTLTTKTTAARSAFNAAHAARETSKNLTQALYQAYDDLHGYVSGLIAKIKGQAESTNNPGVYVLAQIPPPDATPTPAGPPTNATDLTGDLNNDGSVQLRWKGSLAQGQFFSVWRLLPGQAEWEQLGALASKQFTDDTLPSGVAWAQYKVRSHRGTQTSVGTEPVSVLFGVVAEAA